jgi:hypothetical protein
MKAGQGESDTLRPGRFGIGARVRMSLYGSGALLLLADNPRLLIRPALGPGDRRHSVVRV